MPVVGVSTIVMSCGMRINYVTFLTLFSPSFVSDVYIPSPTVRLIAAGTGTASVVQVYYQDQWGLIYYGETWMLRYS